MSVFKGLFNPLAQVHRAFARTPHFEMSIEVAFKDKDGKVIKRIRRKLAQSYVRQIIDGILYSGICNQTPSVQDITNTTRAGCALRADGGAGDDLMGIVVGTGTNAVTINDYALQTKIANGVAGGQLQYGVVSWVAPSTVGSTRQFTLSRTFTNNSGGAITVNEIGLYTYYSPGPWRFMQERSLLTFTINNGASATVTYTFKVTV